MFDMKKDLEDLNDLVMVLRSLSTVESTKSYVETWRKENQEVDSDNWQQCGPSVADMTIILDESSGVTQVWVEKNIFDEGRMIKISQQVF